MQLRRARLCLDCEEIHDQGVCPACSSESFTYISRWVPAPERRARTRMPESQEAARIYTQLLAPESPSAGRVRWIKRGALGLAAIGIAGLFWRQKPSVTGVSASGAAGTAT